MLRDTTAQKDKSFEIMEMPLRTRGKAVLLFVAFPLTICAASAKPTDKQLYACVTTLATMHQDEKPSFQIEPKPSHSTFVLEIHRTTSPDSMWCIPGTNPQGLRLAYCQLPYEADAEGRTYYGEDMNTFRGYFPWHYFALFKDNHFLWSLPVSDGVLIRSGVCTPN